MDWDDEGAAPLVFDQGSRSFRAGFAGDDEPRSTFLSVIGKPKDKNNMQGAMVGDRAWASRGILDLEWPIKRGIITNFDDMEKIWDHAYDDLRIQSKEHNILLTEPALNSRENRERMTEIMFEKYNAPGVYVALEALLSLYSSGRSTGLVLTSGEESTSCIPFYEGSAVRHAIQQVDMGGKDVTDYLMKMFHDRKEEYCNDRELLRDVKEKQAYVAYDYYEETEKAAKTTEVTKHYELPEGFVIDINDERFKCTEILFNPDLIGREECGIAEMCYNAVMKTDVDLRMNLYSNVLLAGGNSLFPGFAERLERDLWAFAPPDWKIKALAPPERQYSAWIGGSILGSLTRTYSLWMLRGEYDEMGPNLVTHKCI